MFTSRLKGIEALEMAKNIEKDGFEFYQEQADRVDDDLKKLFLKLANDEKDHYKRFEELKHDHKKKTGEEDDYVYEPEVSAYLRVLVESTIFPEKAIKSFNNLDSILNFAIQAEKDSILFYQELLKYNKGRTAEVLTRLIKEEKTHLLDLTKYKADLK
ncbi:ferritin family protein [Halothermothrix orenii]|uniref:Rubrerythrin n=1 Tax=Halothermothrix orenii (strain H 168 / OCM 544 / DSM 9562) TaxID=373903 RepID=B8D1S5_HALOH|nr:ferritin family protein [Halothermothrix orenii]ACL69152.1 Rubrerythrin [Halothermothrix orenii H 168]